LLARHLASPVRDALFEASLAAAAEMIAPWYASPRRLVGEGG
jgi:hypothetical protein